MNSRLQLQHACKQKLTLTHKNIIMNLAQPIRSGASPALGR